MFPRIHLFYVAALFSVPGLLDHGKRREAPTRRKGITFGLHRTRKSENRSCGTSKPVKVGKAEGRLHHEREGGAFSEAMSDEAISEGGFLVFGGNANAEKASYHKNAG